MHSDRVGQGETEIGVAAKIEAGEIADHNVLTKAVLRPLINALEATGAPEVAVVLKRAVGDIEHNLHLHQPEILARLNVLPLIFSAGLFVSLCNRGDQWLKAGCPPMAIYLIEV